MLNNSAKNNPLYQKIHQNFEKKVCVWHEFDLIGPEDTILFILLAIYIYNKWSFFVQLEPFFLSSKRCVKFMAYADF